MNEMKNAAYLIKPHKKPEELVVIPVVAGIHEFYEGGGGGQYQLAAVNEHHNLAIQQHFSGHVRPLDDHHFREHTEFFVLKEGLQLAGLQKAVSIDAVYPFLYLLNAGIVCDILDIDHRYVRLVLLPTSIFSMRRLLSFTRYRSRERFTSMFSTKQSLGLRWL